MEINIDKLKQQYPSICVSVDLEGVLIDNWDDFNILYKNKELVQEWVGLDDDKTGEIFSNAVDNYQDFSALKRYLGFLERELSCSFLSTTSCLWRMNATTFVGTLYQYKQQGKKVCYLQYVEYASQYNAYNLYVLLDDQVENELVHCNGYDVLFVKVS